MYLFIEEQDVSRGQTELLESSYNGGLLKSRIRTVLQTIGDKNKNNRIYPKSLLERGLEDLKPMIKSRMLVGELDHPLVTGNDQADSYRHFVVLYKNTSHIFEDVYIEGNKVMGIVETASTDSGRTLAGLIQDKVPVGFSLRAVGETKHRNGITEVCAPFNMITYDSVANPSHANARMVEVCREGVDPKKVSTFLNENVGVYYDRLDLLTNMNVSETNPSKLLENAEQCLRLRNGYEAKKYVDKLLEVYFYTDNKEEIDANIVSFLTSHVNGKMSLSDAFSTEVNQLNSKKYFTVK